MSYKWQYQLDKWHNVSSIKRHNNNMSSTNKLSSRNVTWCQANDITCVKAGRSNRQPKTFHIYGFAGVLAMPNGITRYSRCQRVWKGIFHADLTIVWWYRRYPSRRPSWVKIFASTSLPNVSSIKSNKGLWGGSFPSKICSSTSMIQ